MFKTTAVSSMLRVKGSATFKIYYHAARIVETVFLVSIFQMLIPNSHTMNDNASGVIALLLIGRRLSLDPVLRRRIKLVFTDNEERMLAGSFALKRNWRRNGFDYRNRRIISVDSIGRGNIPVISYNLNPVMISSQGQPTRNGKQHRRPA
ncbi:MAG: M28 family metallopeptidase [Bacteroidetes bacterium]|nr:M28 family metallopeptidase [Bacteroidota bacterium]